MTYRIQEALLKAYIGLSLCLPAGRPRPDLRRTQSRDSDIPSDVSRVAAPQLPGGGHRSAGA
jgi:hypothetical protein